MHKTAPLVLAATTMLCASNADAQEIQLTGPLLGARATCPVHPRAARLEIAPTAGVLWDGVSAAFVASGRVAYFPVDEVGLGVSAGWVPAADAFKRRLASFAVPQLTVVPIDAKLRLLGSLYLRAAIYARGGIGMGTVGRQTYATSDLGFGFALEAARWMTIDLGYDALFLPPGALTANAGFAIVPMVGISASFWFPSAHRGCDGDDDEDVVIALSRGRRRC